MKGRDFPKEVDPLQKEIGGGQEDRSLAGPKSGRIPSDPQQHLRPSLICPSSNARDESEFP
jgi:hypothetical protein